MTEIQIELSGSCRFTLTTYENIGHKDVCLDYTEHSSDHWHSDSETSIPLDADKAREIVAFMRKAFPEIEQPAPVAEPRKQEHVGWMCEDYDKHGKLQSKCIAMNPQRADPDNPLRVVKPLVFANSSPPAQRKPLTDDEIEKIWGIHRDDDEHFDITYERDITRAIEAELQRKNDE